MTMGMHQNLVLCDNEVSFFHVCTLADWMTSSFEFAAQNDQKALLSSNCLRSEFR